MSKMYKIYKAKLYGLYRDLKYNPNRQNFYYQSFCIITENSDIKKAYPYVRFASNLESFSRQKYLNRIFTKRIIDLFKVNQLVTLYDKSNIIDNENFILHGIDVNVLANKRQIIAISPLDKSKWISTEDFSSFIEDIEAFKEERKRKTIVNELDKICEHFQKFSWIIEFVDDDIKLKLSEAYALINSESICEYIDNLSK